MRSFLPFVGGMIEIINKNSKKEYVDFLKEKSEKTETTDNGGITGKIKAIYSYDIRSHIDSIKKSDVAKQLIPRYFIVTLISQFDAFLSKLLKVFFSKNLKNCIYQEKAYRIPI